jgi:hypothetical protein
MINIQGCHQTINIVAGDKVNFLLKQLSHVFGGKEKLIISLPSRRFHCIVSMSTVLLYPSELPDL